MVADVVGPVWLQVILAVFVGATAVAAFVAKVLKPLWIAAQRADRMIPMLGDLTEQLRDVPDVFAILKEIVGQVRTDSGSSLLDIIKRLEAASDRNAAANTALLALLTSLGVRIDAGAATGLRNELAAAVVAVNLSDAHGRADATDAGGPPGEASDAAARSGA